MNSGHITYKSGSIAGIYISDSRMIVFMTAAFTTNTTRPANSGVFRLTHGDRAVRLDTPYDFACQVNDDGVVRITGYIDGSGYRFVRMPVQWQAGTEFRITGVSLATVL